ncbi:hypothetical protein N7475_009518 [Penicillium sp. IBT 31633x]|nr:hypothetical protein N7475_009518 [Penicillium sp. IBT 31633x]
MNQEQVATTDANAANGAAIFIDKALAKFQMHLLMETCDSRIQHKSSVSRLIRLLPSTSASDDYKQQNANISWDVGSRGPKADQSE